MDRRIRKGAVLSSEPSSAAGPTAVERAAERERGPRPDLSALRMDPDELEYRPRRGWIGWHDPDQQKGDDQQPE